MGGASPRSNGAAGQKTATGETDIAGSEYARFVEESQSDPWQCRLPARCQSTVMVTLDCLTTAADLHAVALKIDRDAWIRRIRQDLARFGDAGRSNCLVLARDILGLDIVAFKSKPAVRFPQATLAPALPVTGPSSRLGLARLSFSGGAEMADAATAAAHLDRVLSLDDFTGPISGRMSALRSVLRLHTMARRMARALE